jgi:hypothetical protein
MPLHPQGPKPCTLNETESTTPVYIKVVNTSCHLSKRIIIKDKWFNIIKVQITCEQVSSKNKFSQCARAGCYIHPPLSLNFVPKFLSINAKIKVPQYHKSIISLSITKMETVGAYHMCPPRSSSADYNCPTGP